MRRARTLSRSVLALLLLAAAAAGGAFFAGHPGQVEIVWQGWQIDTSVGVLVASAAILALLVAVLALLVAGLRRLPRRLRRGRAERRRRAGDGALTRGVVALAAGDTAAARRHAQRAAALLDGAPLALLLGGEAARREGDLVEARRAWTALLERPDSEFLGLRGLIGEALRDGDEARALRLAERAQRLRTDSPWLAESLVDLQARAGEWQAARETLFDAVRARALPPARARHHRGVVLHELSRRAEQGGDIRAAAGLAAQAQAAVPDLAAPACHHARLLVRLGRRRAAARAVERAWRTAPHPDLAHLYLDLRPADGPLSRTALLQRLAARNPEASESHFAIAEAALAAQLWGEARRHLGLAAATVPPPGLPRRHCLLMARLEESEGVNSAAARGWLDRAIEAPRDPCYVCRRCGSEAAEWQSLCSECGGFDTLDWRRPTGVHRSTAAGAAVDAAPPLLPAPEPPGREPLGAGGAMR